MLYINITDSEIISY